MYINQQDTKRVYKRDNNNTQHTNKSYCNGWGLVDRVCILIIYLFCIIYLSRIAFIFLALLLFFKYLFYLFLKFKTVIVIVTIYNSSWTRTTWLLDILYFGHDLSNKPNYCLMDWTLWRRRPDKEQVRKPCTGRHKHTNTRSDETLGNVFMAFPFYPCTATLQSSLSPDIQRLWKAYPFERNPTSWVPPHPAGYGGEFQSEAHPHHWLVPGPTFGALDSSSFDFSMTLNKRRYIHNIKRGDHQTGDDEL